jgi:Transposase DDE domain
MDHGVFRAYKRVLREAGAYRRRGREVYSDGIVLAVYFFSVLHRKPVFWACDSRNWPAGALRDGPDGRGMRGGVPSQSVMSRRLRDPVVIALRDRLERIVRPAAPALTLAAAMDGKPMQVAMHSSDPHAGCGRGAGQLARGYKLHAVLGFCGTLLCWRVASLNVSEREMGRRLLRELPPTCYVVGDAFYDTNTLHRAAGRRGTQLLSPRKRSARGKGMGKRRHEAGRLRSVAMLEPTPTPFAQALLKSRLVIERFFAQLSSSAGGLISLPPWVRTYPRVKAWVQTQLIIALLKGTIPAPTRNTAA